jgi:hypothetical protein
MNPKRPKVIILIGLLLVIQFSYFAVMDVMQLLKIPEDRELDYPDWLFIGFLGIKVLLVMTGLFLLMMKRMAAWIFLFAIIPTYLIVSFYKFQFNSNYLPVVGPVFFGICFALVYPHWSKLTDFTDPIEHEWGFSSVSFTSSTSSQSRLAIAFYILGAINLAANLWAVYNMGGLGMFLKQGAALGSVFSSVGLSMLIQPLLIIAMGGVVQILHDIRLYLQIGVGASDA